MSICLVLALVMLLVASASPQLLSSYIGIGPGTFSCRLISNCLRNMTSCADVESAMYSTSAFESEIELCNLLSQAMVDPHIIATYLVLNHRASPSPKEEFYRMSRCDGSFPLKMSECWRAPKR